MGGHGSGRWKRKDAKVVADDLLQVDIRTLNKRGCLVAGQTGTLKWSMGRSIRGMVNFFVGHGYLQLKYYANQNEDNQISINQIIRLESTTCHLGGYRKWFTCPDCSKRVAVIYLVGSSFCCRHCSGLVYRCQNESDVDRSKRKARKIRQRLDASNDLLRPVLFKPKGMHQKTFDSLKHFENDAAKEYFDLLDQSLDGKGNK